MKKHLASQYYRPKGYWKDFGVIQKLAEAAIVSEDVSQQWLFKQAIWQIYHLVLRYVPRPKFDLRHPTPSTKLTVFFSRATCCPETIKFTNTHCLQSMASARYEAAKPLRWSEWGGGVDMSVVG